MTTKKQAYRKKWRAKNKERERELQKIWRAENRDKVNAQARARYQYEREKQLSRHRKRKYGISDDIYFMMVEEQGGACAICGDVPDINLSIDHNHTTEKLRGLICNPCNIALSKAKDSPAILRAMAGYLEKYDG